MARNAGARKIQNIIILLSALASVSRSQQLVYPNFVNAPYNVSIPEDARRNAMVFSSISVNDTLGNNGLISVTCVASKSSPSNACSMFTLTAFQADQQNWNGQMTLAGALDYDIAKLYNLSLQATDNTRINSVSATIYIIDVQNKPPVFQGSINVNVPEQSTTGNPIATYTAIDGDSTNQRQIQYSLSSNPGDYFAINPVTGALTNTKPLLYSDSRWVTGVMIIQVTATELISPGVPATDALSRTTISSQITLLDTNSNTPTFDQSSYKGSILERSPAQTAVPNLIITITDRDKSPFNSQFDITMNSLTDVFEVRPKNGTGSVSAQILVVNSALINYDTGPRDFSFILTARESRTAERRSSTAQVNISLIGQNDYRPVFNPDTYNVSISELAKGGTSLINLTATDDDYGFYGNQSIYYKIQPGTVGGYLFRCNQYTGAVTIGPCSTPGRLSCIDYERDTSYTLPILAVDNYGEGFTATATIYVFIINENDMPPLFSKQEYVADINEGTQVLIPPIIINATDDYKNAISFQIVQGDPTNLWIINSTNYELVPIRPINYDDTPNSQGFFFMTINGTNSYATTAATARVRVLPVNRYSPVIGNYNWSTPDNTPPGTKVGQIHATDGDSPNTPNGQVQYRLASGTGDNFVVDSETGDVTVATGARLTLPLYNISIVADDRGTPQRSGSGILTIYITPTSFAPVFQANPIRISTLETTPVKTILGNANVTDPDPNPVLVYDIIEPIYASQGNGIPVSLNSTDRTMFAVNRTTGSIYVNQPLEFDHINLWQAILRVIDQSSTSPSSATSTATLVVNIYSVNDKPPEFSYPWTPQNPTINVTRSQDSQPDVPVGIFTATSPNNTLHITYKLTDDNNGLFTIDPTSGLVKVNRTLSYANDTNVKFVIVASDDGQPSLSSTATVYLNIQNTNEYAPEFSESSYYAEIPENSPGGTYVLRVSATDKDVGEYGTIRYVLNGESSQFVIDNVTGVITVANGAVLDRETQPLIYLTVSAIDSPNGFNQRFSSVEVLVNLTDVNDNPPTFGRTYYISAIVPADASTNYSIITVQATDPDLGNNGTVRYLIVDGNGNGNGIFKIDPITGEITPNIPLYAYAGTHNLTVMGRDLGTPVSLNSTVQVLITVQQGVSPPPIFYVPAADNSVVYVDEGLPIGSHVITVYANSTTGGNVKYFLSYLSASVEQTPDFRINSTTGEITTNQVFNYDLENSYLVRVDAIDELNAKASRYINVYINKIDTVNPKFPQSNSTCCAVPYYFTVDQTAPLMSIINVVKASLPNPFRPIYYRVIPSAADEVANQYFGVVQSTGQVVVNGTLRELTVNSTYHIVIEAYHADPPHPWLTIVPPCLCNNQSRVDVYILIVDLTDRLPRFSASQYKICVPENREVTASVFQCNNTNYSPDRPVNYTTQSLIKTVSGQPATVYDVSNENGLPFIMPPPNGTIYVNDILKKHLGSYFTERVNASFVGSSKQYDSTTFDVIMWIVQLKDEILVTVKKDVDSVWANLDQYKAWIAAKINKGTICIVDVRQHISPAGALNPLETDILLYAIDGNTNQVVPPLVLDKYFDLKSRQDSDIIGITAANTYWDGFNYIPVAAAIGIIIGLIVLALILFLCCCCFWSWLLKTARYTEKEPLIYNAGSLGAVNPVWNQKMFESQSLSMAVAEGEGMDKTIALHGAYNGYDAGDGDVFGDGTSRLNLQGSQSGLSAITQPGLVHIEAPLSDGFGGASATTQRETTTTIESALAAHPTGAQPAALTAAPDRSRPAAVPVRDMEDTGALPPDADDGSSSRGSEDALRPAARGPQYSDDRDMDYSNMYDETTTDERRRRTTKTSSDMVRAYSTGTMTDDGEDDGGQGRGTVTRPSHSSYDAPIVELTGDGARGPAKIGATLYQPFGITGEQRPQSVISGRETYMNEEDYRGTMAGGYRDGSRSAMSSLPLQKEIVFNDLRPESMYRDDYYENAGGYQRDSDGGAYQGEIRLGTMREPRGSSSDHMHETRYL